MSRQALLGADELRPVETSEEAGDEEAPLVAGAAEYSEIEEHPQQSNFGSARTAVAVPIMSRTRTRIAVVGGAVLAVVAVVAVLIGVLARTGPAVGPSDPMPAPAPAPDPDMGPYIYVPPPVTVPFDMNLQPRSFPLRLNDRRVSRAVGGFVPEELHLTYVSPTSVYISWVTGDAFVGTRLPRPFPTNIIRSLVHYGDRLPNLAHSVTGKSELTYQQVYNFRGGLNYSSGLIHHVTIEDLKPSTTYHYRVGDPFFGTSRTYTFKMPPAPGPEAYPVRMGVFGDIGQTENSTDTIRHLMEAELDAVMLVGDISYADDHFTNDRLLPTLFRPNVEGIPPQSFQRRWDMEARLLEPLIATTPLIVNNGDHEIEPDAFNVTHNAYNARYPVPHAESGSGSNLYYSWTLGPVHGIMLTSYAPFEAGSDQYNWLMGDLEKIDRSVTPWVVASIHSPWYNTYTTHYKENECMRQALERPLFDAGVDVIFAGHVHAYERTNPVFNYRVHACGPVQIMVGDGGNVEGIQMEWVDEPGKCPDPARPPPTYQAQSCPSFQDDDGGYCPTQQPMWSAYREPSFGHGEIEFVNSTHALWQWHRNQDKEAMVTDEYYIERRIDGCPNKLR